MAAVMSQLSFIILLFCGGSMMFHPCQATNTADNCTLDAVKTCTHSLQLHELKPIYSCPSAQRSCLENLNDCRNNSDVDTIVGIFRYFCDDSTGVSDTLAISTCLADDVTRHNFSQGLGMCLSNANWNDGLEGHARCNAATTYAACVRTAAETYCSGDQITRFYDKTVQLWTTYGCSGVEVTTMMPGVTPAKGAMLMPNIGMMAVILGLMVFQLKS